MRLDLLLGNLPRILWALRILEALGSLVVVLGGRDKPPVSTTELVAAVLSDGRLRLTAWNF